MASYLELYALTGDGDLQRRAAVAVAVAANMVRLEAATTPNHTARMVWASRAIAAPIAEGKRALLVVLAINVALTKISITKATDSNLQTAVDAAVDMLAS